MRRHTARKVITRPRQIKNQTWLELLDLFRRPLSPVNSGHDRWLNWSAHHKPERGAEAQHQNHDAKTGQMHLIGPQEDEGCGRAETQHERDDELAGSQA